MNEQRFAVPNCTSHYHWSRLGSYDLGSPRSSQRRFMCQSCEWPYFARGLVLENGCFSRSHWRHL